MLLREDTGLTWSTQEFGLSGGLLVSSLDSLEGGTERDGEEMSFLVNVFGRITGLVGELGEFIGDLSPAARGKMLRDIGLGEDMTSQSQINDMMSQFSQLK